MPLHPGLSALASSALGLAEAMFGPRDESWSFEGVFVEHDKDAPCIKYLWVDAARTKTAKRLGIVIFDEALRFPDKIRHQVYHEVIHLLAPHKPPRAPMIEEGLAVWFSIDIPNFQGMSYRKDARPFLEKDESSRNYRDALACYEQLQNIDYHAIRKLRSIEPAFHRWKIQTFEKAVPQVPRSLALRCLEKRTMR